MSHTEAAKVTVIMSEKEDSATSRKEDVGPASLHHDHTAEVVVEEDFDWNYDVWTNLIAVYMTYFSSIWSMSIAPSELAFINEAFPNDTSLTPWIAVTPNVVNCVVFLFIGEVSDIFGRRWFLILGNALCVAGNLIVGRASSVNIMIGGQVLTGLGTSCSVLSAPVLAEVVPKRSRSIVLAVAVSFLSITTTVASVGNAASVRDNIGGFHQGWRLGIYLGMAFAAVAAVLIIIFYHPSRRPNPENYTIMQRLRRLDWIGLAIGTPGLCLTLLGLEYGGTQYPWTSAHVLGPLIVGCILLVVFAFWE